MEDIKVKKQGEPGLAYLIERKSESGNSQYLAICEQGTTVNFKIVYSPDLALPLLTREVAEQVMKNLALIEEGFEVQEHEWV